MTAERAWRLYRSKGVIAPGFQSEIAERKRLANEWANEGVSLA